MGRLRRLLRRGPRKPPLSAREKKKWLYEHEVPEEQRVSALEGRNPGASVLIVGTGPSARDVIPYDAVLREHWDVIIGLNGAIEHFQTLDYFLSVESKAYLWDWYHHPAPPGCIRCVSESGSRIGREEGRPDTLPAYYLLRHVYEHPVDIRHYRNSFGEEGLLVGPRGETGLGPGTVMLAAMHFAAMIGARSIDSIGSDLHFRGPLQHFYGGNEYGTHEVEGKRYHALDVENRLNPIVTARHPETGEIVETTLHFRESAEYIDVTIDELFGPAGIRVRDLSHGLISRAERGDFLEVVGARHPVAGGAGEQQTA